MAAGSLVQDGRRTAITHITVADAVAVPAFDTRGIALEPVVGDLADPAHAEALARERYDSIFHLAAGLVFEVEQSPERSHAVAVDSLRRLIAPAVQCPRLVFTSSIAVFGGALPAEVDEAVSRDPATTYGVHKAICELLIADATRRGQVDGRCLRLPIVVTRPQPSRGAPTVSDLVASIIREPLQGRDATVPFARETALPLASAGAVVAALIRLHDSDAAHLPANRAVNLPSLQVTAGALADAVGCLQAAGSITFHPDPAIQAVIAGWPAALVSSVAGRIGLVPDGAVDDLIEDYRAATL